MLQSWIADIKKAMSNAITEYMLFAMAVVPFLVAVGLATAAAVIWLAEALGVIAALLLVAAMFAVVGLATLLLAKRYEEPEADAATATEAEGSAQSSSFLDGGAGAMLGLVAAHPGIAFAVLRAMLRNLPALILGSIMGGLLFSDGRRRPGPAGDGATVPDDTIVVPVHTPVRNGIDHASEHRPAA